MHAGLVLRRAWALLRDTAWAFFADNALSRGAALAYYTIFAIAPILLIAIAVAGLFFGRTAAQGAIVAQFSGLMGKGSAEALQALLQGAFYHRRSGVLATALGIVTLVLASTGVFVELQTSLNEFWKVEPPRSITSAMLRARLLSLGLVGALGFLLIVSLVFSAGLRAAESYLNLTSAESTTVWSVASTVLSFVLLTVMFAAIYKVLPDRAIRWRDVGVGSVVTALLFTVGKFLISLYIGGSAIATSYGSVGSLIVILLWVYYSVQIFFFGAEFTKVFAARREHAHRAGKSR